MRATKLPSCPPGSRDQAPDLTYNLDNVFHESWSTQQVTAAQLAGLSPQVVAGFNGTVFALWSDQFWQSTVTMSGTDSGSQHAFILAVGEIPPPHREHTGARVFAARILHGGSMLLNLI